MDKIERQVAKVEARWKQHKPFANRHMKHLVRQLLTPIIGGLEMLEVIKDHPEKAARNEQRIKESLASLNEYFDKIDADKTLREEEYQKESVVLKDVKTYIKEL